MKFFIIALLLTFPDTSVAQKSIAEVNDSAIKSRIFDIRKRTDSFLVTKVGLNLIKKFVPDFNVTFRIGEFAVNYSFLNEKKTNSEDINNLIQYYYFKDSKMPISDTIGIFYNDDHGLEIRFAKAIDSLKCMAIKKSNSYITKMKIEKLIREKRLSAPFLKIIIDEHSLKYSVILKDKFLLHNFYIF